MLAFIGTHNYSTISVRWDRVPENANIGQAKMQQAKEIFQAICALGSKAVFS